MLRLISLFLIISLFALTAQAADGAPSGQRLALLIGNSKYDGFTLPGVGESLDEMEKAAGQQGYQVVRREELNRDEMKKAIAEFATSVPTGGVALVYYVGLGARVKRFNDWYNLLRPIDEKIESDNDYRSRAVNVADDLIEVLRQQSGARDSLIFLDACWQSPIRPEQGEVHGGLMKFETHRNTLVMFAAENEQALKPPGENKPSPFARALAQHLARFNESVQDAAGAVADQTGGSWASDAAKPGLGEPPEPPIEELREGEKAGESFVNSIGMTFRWCPAGEFTMGSEKADSALTRDRAAVKVKLSRGFWMGQHEVTQGEYYAVMRKTPPNTFTNHKNAPFWGVSELKQVDEFCKKLTELDRQAGTLPSGWEYACPSEAEWEYACRAGSNTAFCFGDSPAELGEYGNFADKALHDASPNYYWAEQQANDGVAEALAPVGSYRPNAWGLRDMHGNVAELVADHLTPERPGGTDPLVRVEKDGVMQIRGGAWCSMPLYCESSFRNGISGGNKLDFVGFRVMLKKVK